MKSASAQRGTTGLPGRAAATTDMPGRAAATTDMQRAMGMPAALGMLWVEIKTQQLELLHNMQRLAHAYRLTAVTESMDTVQTLLAELNQNIACASHVLSATDTDDRALFVANEDAIRQILQLHWLNEEHQALSPHAQNLITELAAIVKHRNVVHVAYVETLHQCLEQYARSIHNVEREEFHRIMAPVRPVCVLHAALTRLADFQQVVANSQLLGLLNARAVEYLKDLDLSAAGDSPSSADLALFATTTLAAVRKALLYPSDMRNIAPAGVRALDIVIDQRNKAHAIIAEAVRVFNNSPRIKEVMDHTSTTLVELQTRLAAKEAAPEQKELLLLKQQLESLTFTLPIQSAVQSLVRKMGSVLQGLTILFAREVVRILCDPAWYEHILALPQQDESERPKELPWHKPTSASAEAQTRTFEQMVAAEAAVLALPPSPPEDPRQRQHTHPASVLPDLEPESPAPETGGADVPGVSLYPVDWRVVCGTHRVAQAWQPYDAQSLATDATYTSNNTVGRLVQSMRRSRAPLPAGVHAGSQAPLARGANVHVEAEPTAVDALPAVAPVPLGALDTPSTTYTSPATGGRRNDTVLTSPPELPGSTLAEIDSFAAGAEAGTGDAELQAQSPTDELDVWGC